MALKKIRCLIFLTTSAWMFSGVSAASQNPATSDDAAHNSVRLSAQADNPVSAEAADQGRLTDIVVTARRRKEVSQETPLTIAAIGGATLERRQISAVEQLQTLTPNLHIHRQLGAPDTVGIYLRGFGINTNDPGTNPGVSIFIDGIYQSQANGSQIDFFDLEAIEILRGPQGIILGKNAPSGAFVVRTRRPTGETHGSAQFNYESFNRVEFRSSVEGTLIPDLLSARLSFLAKTGGNYQKDYDADAFAFDPSKNSFVLNKDAPHDHKTGGDDIVATRLSLRFRPSSNIDWNVIGFGSWNRSPFLPGLPMNSRDGAQVTPAGYPATVSPPLVCVVYLQCDRFPRYASAPNFRGKRHIDTYDLTSDLNVTAGPMILSSLTGYKHYDGELDNDIEGLPITFQNVENSHNNLKQFSQEFRISSTDGGGLDMDGRLHWLLGAYYFRNKYHFGYDFVLADIARFRQDVDAVNKSYALFGQAEYEFLDDWKIALGARQTWDKRQQSSLSATVGAPFPPRIPASGKWDKLTLEGTLTHNFGVGKIAYLRYAQGYRGGGIQSFPASAGPGITYDPETADSYEFGIKADWLDRRLRTNFNLFYNKFQDLQRSLGTVLPSGVITIITQNAARAVTKGFELEVSAVPAPDLTLRLNVGYLDAKYKSFTGDILGAGIVTDNSHFHFPHAPRWTFNTGGEYVAVDNSWGRLTLAADYAWTDKQVLNVTDFPLAHQKSFGIANASIRYDDPNSHYYATVYARNLFNEYYLSSVENAGGLATFGSEGLPRTFGVAMGFRF